MQNGGGNLQLVPTVQDNTQVNGQVNGQTNIQNTRNAGEDNHVRE
jgi:hypothetical protein